MVLPCLNEAASLPGVLAAMPDGYRALVVDNNSTDGTADVARRHGAEVVDRTAAGLRLGGACRAWWRRRRRSWRSSTPTGPSTRATCRRWSPNSTAPTWRSGGDAPSTGCGGRGTRGWAPRRCAGGCAPATACPCTTSRRCGWPAATRCLALGVTDRRSGYPLELLVRAAQAVWRVVERDVDIRPAHRRQVEGQRIVAGQFHCGAGLLAGDLVIPVVCSVVAKAPVPGQAKTRLAAGVGDQAAADIAAAALLDTLDAVAAAPVQAQGGGPDRRSGRRQPQ